MRVLRLSVAAVLIIMSVTLVAPIAIAGLTPSGPSVIEEQNGAATVYVSAEPQRVLGYESCQQVIWRLDGIRAVKLNDVGVVGAGEQTICGTSPYLAVTFQDGSAKYYWLQRDVVLTAEARLTILFALGLLLSAPFVLGARLPGWLVRAWPVSDVITALRNEPRQVIFLVLAITLVGFVFRAIYINMPMRIDEGRTFVKYGAEPLSVSLARYDEPGNHVFHTLLVHIVYTLFGNNENWVIRLPAFVAGLLVIPATYAAGYVLYGRAAGLVAAAFVGASSSMIAYSVNAHGYSLVCLFFLLIILLGNRLTKRPSWFGWLLLAVCAALGFYTIPVMLYPYTACMVWLLLTIWLSKRGTTRRRLLIQLIVSGLVTSVLTLILYLPIIQASGLEAITSNQYVSALPWAQFWDDFVQLPSRFWAFATREMPLALQVVFAVTIALGVLPWVKDRGQIARLLLITIAVTLLFSVIQRVVIFDRVMLFLLPLSAIAAGVGVVRSIRVFRQGMEPRIVVVGLAALLYLTVAGAIVVESEKRTENSLKDFEAIAEELQPRLRPVDGVATIMRTPNYEFYLLQNEFPTGPVSYSTDDVPRVYLAVGDGQTPEAVLEFNSLKPDDFAEPQLLWQTESYDVYVVDRLSQS